MTPPPDDGAPGPIDRSVFDRCMALNADAFASGHANVAYHALSAAMHAADSRLDLGLLTDVGRTAAQQADTIDAMQPSHYLSSKAAHARGTDAVFRTLILHVEAAQQRIRAQGLMERAQLRGDVSQRAD